MIGSINNVHSGYTEYTEFNYIDSPAYFVIASAILAYSSDGLFSAFLLVVTL